MKNIKIVNYENKYSRQNHSELESVKKNQKHGPDSHSIWHMVINFLPGIVVSR